MTTTLALALFLSGCGVLGNAPLMTVDNADVGCVLSYWVADVVADPTLGTVDKETGEPLLWPSGYTGRWAGVEIEVVDSGGRVVLTTGGRYRLSPIYAGGYPNGPIAICSPKPCPECRLGEGGPL